MHSSSPSSTLHKPGHLIIPQGHPMHHYRIVRLLGKGGMGETYEAEALSHQCSSTLPLPKTTPQTSSRVALKVLSLRQMVDWKSLDLFERETKVLAHLNHPGIPCYLDSFCVDVEQTEQAPSNRHFYLVREFIPGESLGDRVSQGWRPQETELKIIALQVLCILGYLHTLSPPLIHRDIKPQNLIRRPDGMISLVDFGSVQEIYRHTFLGSNTFVGTVGYMPPEQFRGQVSPASDLYGLGATLLYLATQKTPDQLPQSRMKVNLAACTNFSPLFTAWLDKLLEPMEEDRFQQAKTAERSLKQPGLMLSPKKPKTVSNTPMVTTSNALATIPRPAHAKSVVERSPQAMIITIPIPHNPIQRKPIIFLKLWRIYVTRSGKLVNREGTALEGTVLSYFLGISIVVILLIILFTEGWGAGAAINTVFILGLLSQFLRIVAMASQNPFTQVDYQEQADTVRIEIRRTYFILKYLNQDTCEYLIRDATKNFQISLKPYYFRDPNSSTMTCSFSEKLHSHQRQRKDYRFGHGLTLAEQEWLVNEISAFLKALR